MWNQQCCDVCSNELDLIGLSKYACRSCYAATGPDWQMRWLVDSALASRPSGNITYMLDYSKKNTRRSVVHNCIFGKINDDILYGFSNKSAEIYSLNFHRITRENANFIKN